MNARWYLPGLARFISADTLVPNPTNPQSLNRYSYVFNQPIIYNDPTGHCPWCISAIAGAVVGAAISYGTQVADNYRSGMDFGQALTTNIDGGEIVAGAVGGAIVGGTFGAAAAYVGGGTLAGVGLGQLTTFGAAAGLISGQASALTEATVHNWEGEDTDVNAVYQEARNLGFLDSKTILNDTAAGAATGLVAGIGSQLLQSFAKDFGIAPLAKNVDAHGKVVETMYLESSLGQRGTNIFRGINAMAINSISRSLGNQAGSITEDYLDEHLPE